MRDLVEKRLHEMADVTIPNLEGTYLMFPKFNYGFSSDKIYKVFLKDAKVAFSNSTSFGPRGDEHLRILTATSKEIMNEATDRIAMVIPKLEKMAK